MLNGDHCHPPTLLRLPWHPAHTAHANTIVATSFANDVKSARETVQGSLISTTSNLQLISRLYYIAWAEEATPRELADATVNDGRTKSHSHHRVVERRRTRLGVGPGVIDQTLKAKIYLLSVELPAQTICAALTKRT